MNRIRTNSQRTPVWPVVAAAFVLGLVVFGVFVNKTTTPRKPDGWNGVMDWEGANIEETA
jgi:hypothetical protein